MKKRVYIAGPLVLGDLGSNIEQAVAAYVKLVNAGLAPMCPHLSCFASEGVRHHFGYWAKAELLPRDTKLQDWYDLDLSWVAVSEAVLRLPGEGKGSDGEVAFAEARGIPVFYSVEDVIAWVAA